MSDQVEKVPPGTPISVTVLHWDNTTQTTKARSGLKPIDLDTIKNLIIQQVEDEHGANNFQRIDIRINEHHISITESNNTRQTRRKKPTWISFSYFLFSPKIKQHKK